MKIFAALLVTVVLSACAAPTPVRQTFPQAVPELMEPCDRLRTIVVKDDVAITELLRTVTENYQNYHICSERVAAWQEWYRSQRQINESIR